MNTTFSNAFLDLTGNPPLKWQTRLFDDLLAGREYRAVDLPTGLGKTSVIAIWYLARAAGAKLPTRLVYVVDRRTVVDQATEYAKKVSDYDVAHTRIGLTISTLRGQFADNREWTRHPLRPAIIIGTVDMIGSRLLFSGYRSSYKQRPLDAGLLGQDSLLVLDEAHLSEPFAKLLDGIGSFQRGQGSPMRVIRMSATASGTDGERFALTDADLAGDRNDNLIVRRFEATKRLTVEGPVEKTKLDGELAQAAVSLAQDGSRVVVYVRSPVDAEQIAATIRSHAKKSKAFAHAVAVLTGTMRGLERDELVTAPDPTRVDQHERRVMLRFLAPENDANQGPAILVSTSAGEVGFDLNADHLVCDAAPLDSMVQRLGRANRRGDGTATVRVFIDKAMDAPNPAKAKPFDLAAANAIRLLRTADGAPRDASPKAIAALTKGLTAEELDAASTPKPAIVDLTDILLDAWSMTSIVQPMPGRPEVGPWLRGIADEMPQTTIAWRTELDVDGFDQLGLDDISEWFDAHRILPHETLNVRTDRAAAWLIERWDALPDSLREEAGTRCCVIDRGGLQRVKLPELVVALRGNRTESIRDADIVLPASFGGIQRGAGILDSAAPKPADNSTIEQLAALLRLSDVADVRQRHRYLETRSDSGEISRSPLGSEAVPDEVEHKRFAKFAVDLPSETDIRRRLVSVVPKREQPELGSSRQTLTDHVGRVRACADQIIDRLGLASGDTIRFALELAADWHDHGKNRECWQRTVRGQATPSIQPWSDQTLGKSGGSMLPDRSGYRHEFGSLREFVDACEGKVAPEVFDLTMHLIAAHHGRSRPHFPKGGFDPDARARSPQIHADASRRFARLQRKYGLWHLAWIENLLRCADAIASAENENGGGQ